TVTGIASNLCKDLKDRECRRYNNENQARNALTDAVKDEGGVPTLLVGAELFEKLDLEEGATVLLSTPVGLADARGNAPKRMRFRLGRAFRSGMYEFDSRLVYASLEATQRLMGMGKAVTGVELRVSNPDRVEMTSNRVLRAIGRYPYRTLDWRKLNEGIFRALSLQKIVFFLVLSFIIVVAAFNIASTLFMAVVEKSAEIGVLKSMGARDTSIMRIFVMEGWIVGGLGTAVGIGTGLLVCSALNAMSISIAANVYMVDSLTVRIRPLEVTLVAVAAMVISHLATLYPALKGARARPVDAIRYD
ncbi:MAG: ABC transporter permease, partial [Myxococcota bacterium]